MLNKFAFAVAAFVTIATSPIAQALQNDSSDTVSQSDLEKAGYVCFGPASDGMSYCINGGSGPGYQCDAAGMCTVYTGLIRHPRNRIPVAPTVGSVVASPQPTSTPISTVLVPIKATVK